MATMTETKVPVDEVDDGEEEYVTVTIYHNEGEDHFWGYNERTALMAPVFTYAARVIKMERPPVAPDDPVEMVIDSRAIADQAFELFNAPQEMLSTNDGAGGYSSYAIGYTYHQGLRLRSLSVGDVVVVGPTAWACKSAGWMNIDPGGMTITPRRWLGL